ncbi:MAG: hypothetical protein APF76_10590 [Desulfitibacter sp. BRH_c19]|nr:MAG: hypothetical protein APF76_10590 [Desulfitibacter sp. BRH_c19]
MVGYYNFLLPDMDMVSITRYIAFNLALYLLFIAIPYLGREDGFELYVIKLFTGFIVTYSYSLILFGGLVAILFTINTLFSAGIPEEVYFDLWLLVAGIFAPAYFLAGIPAYGVAYKSEDYPKFLQILLLYIVMPLLSVYTAILYVYFVKIIVIRYWPAGIVSHLVLWYAFVSTIVIFFIYLLKEKNTWARTFIAYFPKLILPLLLMMFVAMGIRINAYGITENRYLVMVGGLWITGSMLYFAFKKNTMNIKIVISVAIIAVLVVSGPCSSYAVSKYSQNNQMEKLLINNNMLVDGSIVPSEEISQTDKISISSIVQYFNRYYSLTELKVVPQDFSLNQMQEVFGFDLTYSYSGQNFSHHPKETRELVEIREYDYFSPSYFGLNDVFEIKQGSLSVSYASQIIKISKEGQVIYEKDIAQVALDIHAANIGENVLENKDMTFVDENEQLKVMFLFQNINGKEDGGNGQPRIEWLNFSVLFTVY